MNFKDAVVPTALFHFWRKPRNYVIILKELAEALKIVSHHLAPQGLNFLEWYDITFRIFLEVM